MPTTVITEPHAETRLPARPDGSPWPLLLVHGDRVTGADTATELLGQLIPGYSELTGDDAGHDDALIAELRAAFLESARHHVDLLARSRCDANWRLAAGRLKGLAASFGIEELVRLAAQAEAGAPGDPVVRRKLAQAIDELAG